MTNQLINKDLNTESFVREIIEKTLACGLIWSQINGVQFRSTFTNASNTWQYDVSKTQISQLSYRYNLDVRKNGSMYVAVEDGVLIYSQRESMVKELYETVEMIVLELDAKLKEAQAVIQQRSDCRG